MMSGKRLVVYYSLSNGNTKRIAELAAEAMDAELYAIDTARLYSGTYQQIVDQGLEETKRGYQPELKPLGFRVADYDLIAVGTPTWWYTMAPAVLTFLNGQDWRGKRVIPFMTNGGWPGHVLTDMKHACKGAEFLCEKEIRFDAEGGSQMVTSDEELKDWLELLKRL